MGETLDYRGWSKLKIEFLRDHIDAAPPSRDRVGARLRLDKVLSRYARWQEAEPQSRAACDEAACLGAGFSRGESVQPQSRSG